MIEIVKVQVPIAGNGPALVYAQGHTRSELMPISRTTKKALRGKKKGYFEAEWSSSGGWRIFNRVPDQGW